MAISWSDFRSAVEAAVTAAMPTSVSAPANNDGPTVTWTDGRRPFAKHRLLLDVVSVVINHDRDTALTEGGDQDLSSMVTAVVQIQAESAHAGPSSLDALWLLEQVRLGLRRVSVAEALATAGVRIGVFPLAIVNRKYPADGRMISAHSFDVAFRFVMALDSDETVGQIEHVEIEGDPPGPIDEVEVSVDDPDPDV